MVLSQVLFLETVILMRQMNLASAFKTAIGMSLISMISMEIAMNLVDYLVTGGAKNKFNGYTSYVDCRVSNTWPYNYWRLKKFNKGCCA